MAFRQALVMLVSGVGIGLALIVNFSFVGGPMSGSVTRLPQVLALVLSVGLAACSAAGADPDAIRSQLDARIPEVFARGNAPSMQVAVVEGDRVIWPRAFGEGAATDRLYMNASVQKTFSATAVLQLVEKGLIDLDKDVNAYLPFEVRHPGFPDTPITVRMLLAHRSGLESAPYEFCYDTQAAFAPEYRRRCPAEPLSLPLAGWLAASLTPGGPNYTEDAWVFEPDSRFNSVLMGEGSPSAT